MRKYEVKAFRLCDEPIKPEIIEADKIHASWNGAVEFLVEDKTMECDYGENYRTIAVRQNANVTELRE